MSNGEVCCILGVCCPAGSAAQLTALAHEIHKQRPQMTEALAQSKAAAVLELYGHFAEVLAIVDAPSDDA